MLQEYGGTPPCALSAKEYMLPAVPGGMVLVVIIKFEALAGGLVLPQPKNEQTAKDRMTT